MHCTFHYISFTDSLKATRSQLFSNCYLYTFMIFHDSLSYVATLVKHFQFDINTFNNNNNNNNILDNK